VDTAASAANRSINTSRLIAALAGAAITYASKFAKDQRDQMAKLKEVKLEAERRLGQVLQKVVKRGAPKKGNTSLPLDELG
jgi:hypothetical protein